MVDTYVCHSPADGLEAVRIRDELETLGLAVRKDLTGEPNWPHRKQFLRQVLEEVDVVVVILSPDSVDSKEVEWVWDTALTRRKHLALFLVKQCSVPDELREQRLYDLSSREAYTRELLRFAGGIIQLRDTLPQYDPTNTLVLRNEPYSPIGQPSDFARSDWQRSVEDEYLVITLLVKRYPVPIGTPATLSGILPVLKKMQRSVGDIETGVRDLKVGQERILARFDLSEQRIVGPILARLDAQHAAEVAALLDVLDAAAWTHDELASWLAPVSAALLEARSRAALPIEVNQTAELIEAPGLDVKHKLKLSIPLIPFLLDYESELEFDVRANLESAWQALRRLISRR